jgi:hypothetical protein
MFGQIQGMASSDSVSCQLNFTVRKLRGSLSRFSAPNPEYVKIQSTFSEQALGADLMKVYSRL